MAIKKSELPCGWETKRTHRGLPKRAALLYCTRIGRLGVIMTPSRPKYTKIPPQTGGSSYFLIEKKNCLKQHLNKNLYQDIIIIHFVRNRSRIKNIFTSGHFELCLFKISGVIYAPAIQTRV
jgi:hypothetical protein